MVEGLSRRLGDYSAENGHTLYTVIWYSSSTERWGTTHTLEYYMHKYKPTYVIICLGSNELFVNDLENRAQYVREIVKKLGNTPFVWISPQTGTVILASMMLSKRILERSISLTADTSNSNEVATIITRHGLLLPTGWTLQHSSLPAINVLIPYN